MVNTFVVSIKYEACAQALDMKRLGKQRLEAKQILLLLEDYSALRVLWNISLETNPMLIKTQIRTLWDKYKALGYKLVRRGFTLTRYDPKVPLQPEDRLMGLGFGLHPAVRMWYGYEEALKLYYNYIVKEWIGRGYKNTLPYYNIDVAQFKWPSWIGDQRVYSSHRASLVHKNKDYYAEKFGPLEFTGYYWPV